MHVPAGREVLDLAVRDNRQTDRARVFHRVEQCARVTYRVAVIAESNNARRCQIRQLSQLLTFARPGNRTCRIDMTRGGLSAFVESAHRVSRIRWWIGVRHRHNAGNATRNGGLRTGCNRFFVLVTGLAQVNVDIHQSRRNNTTGYVDCASRSFRARRDDFRDFSFGDDHILRLVDTL